MDKKHTTEMLDKIIKGVNDIDNSDKYIDFLKFCKTFHNYSFNNKMLIYLQNNQATKVAGFKTWQKFGKSIRKGEQGIKIFAPIKIASKNSDEQIEEDNDIKSILIFRPTYVFDISQIDGEKPLDSNKLLHSESSIDLYNNLCKFSPFPITYINSNNQVQGYWNESKQYIAINNNLSIDDKSSVLLHELAHALYDDFDYKKNRNLSEIFVESIAFIVADYFNLDTSLCSFEYITSWSKGDTKLIIDLGTKIQNAANDFIRNIEKHYKIERVA